MTVYGSSFEFTTNLSQAFKLKTIYEINHKYLLIFLIGPLSLRASLFSQCFVEECAEMSQKS